MNLRELEYICAVARHRHFGKAAKACHVSQPTLSSQIIKLESELGVTIFERMRGAVRLTKAGEDIIAKAELAKQAARDIKSIAKAHSNPFAGEFSLGVIPTIGPFLLPHFSKPLVEKFPKLQLAYIEDTTDRLTEQLLSGDLDAAILATLPTDDALTVTPLYDERFHIALTKGHDLCRQKQISLADLEREKLLLLTDGHCLRDQTLSVCSRVGTDSTIRATSLDTLLGLVAGGQGITLIPTLAIRKAWMSEIGVVVRPISEMSAHRKINLTVRKSNLRLKLIDALGQLILANLSDKRVKKAKKTQ